MSTETSLRFMRMSATREVESPVTRDIRVQAAIISNRSPVIREAEIGLLRSPIHPDHRAVEVIQAGEEDTQVAVVVTRAAAVATRSERRSC